VNLDENLAVTLGGGFLGGILIGYALKKVIKVVAIIAGFFLAALAYLQYQQIASSRYRIETMRLWIQHRQERTCVCDSEFVSNKFTNSNSTR
jgi:uncharacterized membrane protein (Fun14 family)